MLAPDVRFEGFTHQDWTRFLELFEPLRPEGKPRDPDRPQGLVVALHGGGRLLKLLHSKAGRLRLDDVAPDWPISSAELARRHDASWAIKLDAEALVRVMETLGLRLRRQDDHTTQWLVGRGHALGEGDHVRHHAHAFASEPVPEPAERRDDLDSHQQHAVPVADAAQFLPVADRWNEGPAPVLNRLSDDHGHRLGPLGQDHVLDCLHT